MTATEQHDDYSDIREAVAKLCAQFPGEYWRKLDREMAYRQHAADAGAAAVERARWRSVRKEQRRMNRS